MLKKNVHYLFLLIIMLSSKHAFSDESTNLLLEFGKNTKLSEDFFFHYFSPVEDGLIGYNKQGEEVIINKTDTILINSVETGRYKNFNGDWLVRMRHQDDDIWVPFTKKMRDVTEEKRKTIKAEVAAEETAKTKFSLFILAVYILLMLPFVYVGFLVRKHAPQRTSSLLERNSYLN